MQTAIDRILREAEVEKQTGLSRTTRWRLVKEKKFPAPIKLSGSAVGWRESDVQKWIRSLQATQAA